jgi:hypothetical protein
MADTLSSSVYVNDRTQSPGQAKSFLILLPLTGGFFGVLAPPFSTSDARANYRLRTLTTDSWKPLMFTTSDALTGVEALVCCQRRVYRDKRLRYGLNTPSMAD